MNTNFVFLYFFCLFLIISCTKTNEVNIKVKYNSIYEFDFSKGEGVVYNRNGKTKFLFNNNTKTNNELKKIISENKLFFQKDTLLNSEGTKIRYPRGITVITIVIDNKENKIRYQDDGFDFPYERIKNKELKDFLMTVSKRTNTISDSLKLTSDSILL